jgi:hypothetical protein
MRLHGGGNVSTMVEDSKKPARAAKNRRSANTGRAPAQPADRAGAAAAGGVRDPSSVRGYRHLLGERQGASPGPLLPGDHLVPGVLPLRARDRKPQRYARKGPPLQRLDLPAARERSGRRRLDRAAVGRDAMPRVKEEHAKCRHSCQAIPSKAKPFYLRGFYVSLQP